MALFILLSIPLVLHIILAQDVATTVTVPPSIPSEEPEWDSDRLFTSAVLNSTNFYRGEHNASDVSWNETLARFAADYLDDNECEFEHSGGPYGENLAMGYPNVTASIEAWGDEREEYDFDDAEFETETGHFTQLVWRDTTDVGCERRLCGESGWYLVCEYWPRGNVEGAFETEVIEEEGGAPPTPMASRLGLVMAILSVLYVYS